MRINGTIGCLEVGEETRKYYIGAQVDCAGNHYVILEGIIDYSAILLIRWDGAGENPNRQQGGDIPLIGTN